MTESDVIAAAERYAARRWHRLGRLEFVYRVSSDSAYAGHPHTRHYVGNWIVVFRQGENTLGRDRFLVYDDTGRVEWLYGPPPLWLALMMWPVYWLMMGPVIVFDRIANAWYDFRMPRCPRCNAKLRTHRAQQCRVCRYDWHQQPESRLKPAGLK